MRKQMSMAVVALAVTAALGVSGVAQARSNTAAATATAPVALATKAITEADVIAAQNAWGDALVKIAKTHDEQGAKAARATAEAVIDGAYGYASGPVLFKPTLTVAPQTFRTTRAGALAYFVGGDPAFPKDTGFALNGWRSYTIQNAAIFIDGDIAISMGKVRLTDKAGKVTEVDKTWGYKRDEKGVLRIVLHHSSLPYTGG